MARTKITQKLGDEVAKRLWSGDVREGSEPAGSGNLSGGPYSYRKSFPVIKEEGVRVGVTPNHIHSPQQGKARPFDPFSLRTLADTEPVQIVTNTIIKDMRAIPMDVVPLDDDAEPDEDVMVEAERAMKDANPNPESLNDINEMLLRDGMEVGNSSAVINTMVDGRRAEVIPHDPNTFTVDWSQHRILQDFWQYPNAAGSRFGNPQRLDPDIVMWGVANPETQRAGFYGHSPTEKVQMAINVIGGLVESEIKELEEGMPPGIIALVGDEWDDDDYEAFETYWQNEVQGQQHKVPYTRGQSEFIPFNHSYKDLKILERQQWYHKLVGAAFNVPTSESGLQVGETNRATDVSIRQKYKSNALRPWLEYLEDIWTYQYLHRYWSDQVKARFNPSLDLMERKEQVKVWSTMLHDGLATVNEIREQQMGKDPVEWGDEPFKLSEFARQNGDDGLGGMMDGLTDGSDDIEDGDDPATPEEEAQEALDEGIQQDLPEEDANPLGNSQVSKGPTWLSGLYIAKGSGCGHNHVQKDDDGSVSPQQAEVRDLHSRLEAIFGEYIEDVMAQIRANQDVLKSWSGEAATDTISKDVSDFMKIVEDEIGLDFAEDVAEVVTEHKMRQILDGEEAIMDELAAAGLSPDDVALDEIRDRIAESVRGRTLEVTKPISQRLEDDLQDVLHEGWRQGQSIEEIERAIEDMTDKWQGHDAERLARDQLQKASKEGRLDYAEATADKVGGWMKTWLTTGGASGDGRTRESHMEMHNTTVPESDPFVVDYSFDGGPTSVEEDYPGQSVYGIQCRCGISLSPQQKYLQAKEWGTTVRVEKAQMAARIEEVEAEQGAPIHQVLLRKELAPGSSREETAQALGVSKPTLYKWLRGAGLHD